MATFPFPVKADLNDDMSLPSIVLSYGDGNKQRSPDGLNLPKTVWNIQCPVASKSQSATLQSFLIGVGNHIPFLWQSPRDTKPEFYYITSKVGGTYRLGGGNKPDFFVRSMQFEYANIAVVERITIITPPESLSIIGGTEATGFTISISATRSADTIVYLNRGYYSAYTNFLTENITVTIPANLLSVNLPFGDRKTTASFGRISVSILNNPSYSVSAHNLAEINFP